MNRRPLCLAIVIAGLVGFTTRVNSQTPKTTVYAVATSHLDSQWNWTVQDSIRQFIPATFFENFDRFERFPSYTFNWEGAIHYMWFKEYHPEAWPLLQKYVAAGRWRVAGNWIDAVDVNVPSPESLMRHALYAKRFFREEFGQVSQDVYLPDCFGFGFALPSIAMHSGLSAFTTQKLTWGSSYGIPFPIGRWKGVDGSEVVAALNRGAYVTKVRSDISIDPKWSDDPTILGNGRQIVYRLFGVGDVGGAPDTESVDWLEKSLANKSGTADVRTTSVDQLSRDLTVQEKAALPVYEGELTMKTHGVGTYTSQAYMKRLNRQNELLADSAERAAVAAQWLAGLPYPGSRLSDAWIRFLWHQFHDDLTGTSIPQAYQFSWNDELVSANQFAAVLHSSTTAVADRMDTLGSGVPLIVYNPLSTARRDVVEARVQFSNSAPDSIRVLDRAAEIDVPVQILDSSGDQARILFLADVPSVSFKVFEVRAGRPVRPIASSLKATTSSVENSRYAVRIDDRGDLSSIFDKEAGRELLKAPIRLEMRDNPSPDKPAWRILWETVSGPAREYVAGTPEIRVVEQGPVRATIRITRKAAGSTFTQNVVLTEGGDRVDIENDVDWRSPNTLLKVAFPFAASNPKATFDLGLGTISRGNEHVDAYEVPAQKWADLTDTSNAFGTAVMNDSKYGWDKPADNVLRLTLLHTALPRATPYQGTNDLGHHHYVYAIAGHRGDWTEGRVPTRALRLNQPLVAFQATPHAGPAGRNLSMASLSDTSGQFTIQALKKAEDSDEVVVRLQELYGKPGRTRITFAGNIIGAREINAAEESIGSLSPVDGALTLDFKPYQPRTIAIRLERRNVTMPARVTPTVIDLPFNLDGISMDSNRVDGNFDGGGLTLAGELWPSQLQLNGIPFKLGAGTAGAKNILVPQGQTLPVTGNRLYILAASVGADVKTMFGTESITVREWQGPIGQWDSRLKEPRLLRDVVVPPLRGQTWTLDAIQQDMVVQQDLTTGVVTGIDQMRRGFVKRDEIAWIGTHRHAPDGNQIYIPSYVFMYGIDLPPGTKELRLPSDDRLRIFAATAVSESNRLRPAVTLYSPELPER